VSNELLVVRGVEGRVVGINSRSRMNNSMKLLVLMVIWMAPVLHLLHPRIWFGYWSPWVPLEFLGRKNVCRLNKRGWISWPLDFLCGVGASLETFLILLWRSLTGTIARNRF